MIGIYGSDTERIAQAYYKRLREWLKVSEQDDKFQKLMNEPGIEEGYKRMLNFVYKRIKSKPEKLILAKPDTLKDIADVFNRKFNDCIKTYKRTQYKEKKNTAFGKFKNDMESFYKGIMNDGYPKKTYGMHLSRSLNIRTCPYCNRSYTFSINNNVKVRPEFDHFYPKANYPCLALCFYNLIPSCPMCNHLKREQKIDLNPYLIDTDNSPISFKLKNKNEVKTAKDIKLKVVSRNGSGSKNIKVLGLQQLYDEHKDYVKEIMDKALAYNNSYYDSLTESFRGMGLSTQDIDNRIWGTYIENSDLGKRPLSKLTHDILKKYNIKE